MGGAPLLASMGRGPSIGALSVPPSWAASGVPEVSSTPVTLTGAGFTSAAPQTTTVSAIPGGVPSMASAGRGGYGLGAPRYGVKPTVMPKPAV
jgi:PPE-repeat protein